MKKFNLVSLCISSFRIAMDGKFLPLRSQILLIIWPMHTSHIVACTYTPIIWCIHLYKMSPNQSRKWAISYRSTCTWIRDNRVLIYLRILRQTSKSLGMCTKPLFCKIYGGFAPKPWFCKIYRGCAPKPLFCKIYGGCAPKPLFCKIYGRRAPKPLFCKVYGGCAPKPLFCKVYGGCAPKPLFCKVCGGCAPKPFFVRFMGDVHKNLCFVRFMGDVHQTFVL